MSNTTTHGSTRSTPPAGNASGNPSTTGSASAGSGSPTGASGSGPVTGIANPGLTPAGVPSPKKKGIVAKITARLNGLENFLPATVSLVVNGQAFTVAQLVSSFTTMDGLYTALTTVEQQSKTAITQAKQAIAAELPAFEQLLVGLDNTLRGYFGRGNPVLANFGIATGARKKQPSSTTKAVAQASAKLTRKARNTLGKKQKLKVTGGKATVQFTAPDGTAITGSNPVPPAGSAAPSGIVGGNANGSNATK